MVVHKIKDDSDETECGLDVFKNRIDASRNWKSTDCMVPDVNCKKCLEKKKTKKNKIH